MGGQVRKHDLVFVDLDGCRVFQLRGIPGRLSEEEHVRARPRCRGADNRRDRGCGCLARAASVLRDDDDRAYDRTSCSILNVERIADRIQGARSTLEAGHPPESRRQADGRRGSDEHATANHQRRRPPAGDLFAHKCLRESL